MRTGYWFVGRSGSHCWYCAFKILYCFGMMLRAILKEMGVIITVPLSVPVLCFVYFVARGFDSETIGSQTPAI